MLTTTCLAALLAGCFPDPPARDATDSTFIDEFAEIDGDVIADVASDAEQGDGDTSVIDSDTSVIDGDTSALDAETSRPDGTADSGDAADANDVTGSDGDDGEVVVAECDGNGDCTRLDGLCVEGTCDSGACVAHPLTGTACDDGLACTTDDICDDGVCSGDAVTCAPLDQCHDAGLCDTATGNCTNPASTAATECDDGLACTRSDSCAAGTCQGAPVVCEPLDQCHDPGQCDALTGTCSNPTKSNTATCDDGVKCTKSDTCTAGVCGGAVVVCKASDQCHNAGVCNALTGLCSDPARDSGVPCNDNDRCTLGSDAEKILVYDSAQGVQTGCARVARTRSSQRPALSWALRWSTASA